MIVTLYLISANVYNSVDAPHGRGFSYIEIWMIGAQFPILLALCEYGFVLYLKKVTKKSEEEHQTMTHHNMNVNPGLDDKIKRLDFATMTFSFIFFVLFCSSYWIMSLTLEAKFSHK